MNSIKKIAIVTGSSRGIGRDAVLRLAARGVSSIVTYQSRRNEAEDVVALVKVAGADAIALPLDVGNAAGFDGFVDAVRKALAGMGTDRFDFLVNNAGSASSATFAKGTEADLDSMFAIHFKGPFLLSQKLLPLMRDGGRIINVSSGLARFTFPNRSVYGPMKAAVEALTRYMAMELGPRRITVNVVAPGAVATDFSGGMVRDNPQINQRIAGETALGRVAGAEDIGPVIAGLLSEDFGWINAQRIEVSGGIHI